MRTWFMRDDPANSIFQKTHSVNGEPDIYCARRYKNGSVREFRAEAKYVDHEPTSLQKLWGLLQKNQQIVIPRMANASKVPIYLITCIAGREALWHLFSPDACRLAMAGKKPPWEVLALVHESRRDPTGKWKLVNPSEPRQRA